MKYFKIKNIAVSLTVLGMLAFYACSDDDSYDVTGNPDNLAYIKVNGETSDKAPKNQLSFNAVQTPIGNFNDVDVKFPIWVTKQANDVTVTTEIVDPSIDEYNTKYNASCLPLPDGMLKLEKNTVTVKQGEYLSSDSISVTMDNSRVSELEVGKEYLAAVKLTSLSNNNAKISSNLNTVYFKIQAKKELAKQNAGSASMLGTIISDYSAWTYTSSNTTSSISNLWGSSSSSGLSFNSNPSTVVFDMKSIKKISGIRAYSRYANYGSNYMFSNIKFSLSKDNVTFEEVANFSRSQMAAESGYQYICMYGGVEAQYIKLELSWPSTSYMMMVYFGAYVQD